MRDSDADHPDRGDSGPHPAETRAADDLGPGETRRLRLCPGPDRTPNEGLEGVGEATVTPRWSGETVWGARAIIEHVFAPALIGCDPRDDRRDRPPARRRCGRQLVRQGGPRDGLLGHRRPRGREAGLRAARRGLPPADRAEPILAGGLRARRGGGAWRPRWWRPGSTRSRSRSGPTRSRTSPASRRSAPRSARTSP